MSGLLRVVFAGGGTGGHLYPAIAIAEELRRRVPEADITFVGTRGKIEERTVPEQGFKFVAIWISGFRRSFSLSVLTFPLKVVVALVQSLVLLLRLKPEVVVGTGGYVCGPPRYVASLLGIPTLIQEQNSYPGVTTRMLAGRVDEVHLTFESSKRFFNRAQGVFVTGNPVRSQVGKAGKKESLEYFGLEPSKTTVLIFGGSLGASSLNAAVSGNLAALKQMGVQVLWQTGNNEYEKMSAIVRNVQPSGLGLVKAMSFIERMDLAFGASDLAVCRAGATTLAELACAGLPSILVPYPHAAADHQTENARTMVDAGAALMCSDGDIGRRLIPLLTDVLEKPGRLLEMRAKANAMARPDAAVMLANAVMRLGGYGS